MKIGGFKGVRSFEHEIVSLISWDPILQHQMGLSCSTHDLIIIEEGGDKFQTPRAG